MWELLRSSLASLNAVRMYAMDFFASLAQGFAIMGRLDQALPPIDKTIAQVKKHRELLEPELQRVRGELLEKTADDTTSGATPLSTDHKRNETFNVRL